MPRPSRSVHSPRALLDACIAGRELDALALIARGSGLRYFCPRLNIEPLSACAEAGLPDAFRMLLSEAYFDPHESALQEAMSRATSRGHVSIAAIAWRYGASLNFSAIDTALDLGHAKALLALMDIGAIESSRFGGHGEFPSAFDYFFESCCSRGLDLPATACIARGASSTCDKPAILAKLLAQNHMQSSAQAWLAAGSPIPPLAESLWLEAFPGLMLCISERTDLSTSPQTHNASRKPRL